MKPTTQPSTKPATTCDSECWRRIMRQVPSTPATRSTTQSQKMGLKPNIIEKAAIAPAIPPMAAVWVLIFHHTLTMEQSICMMSAAMSMLDMKCGMCMLSMIYTHMK